MIQAPKWKPTQTLVAPPGPKRSAVDMEAAGLKRVRLLHQVSRHGTRKVALALESALPAEVSWGLGAVLQASCGLEGHLPSEKLELLASLPRNPVLLPALLALALPEPPEDAYDVLRPCPPSQAQLRALGRLHRRQAWLCLRNMAHMPENEAALLQSAPLRALLFHTLQRGLHNYEGGVSSQLHEVEPYSPQPHLTISTLELAEAVDESGGAPEAGLGEGEANYNSRRSGGGGRGRGARRVSGVVRGKRADDAGARAEAALARGTTSHLMMNLDGGSRSISGREAPLPSEEFDPAVQGTAAELLGCLCRQAKLDDLPVRLPPEACCPLPESVPELCSLLATLLRCGEHHLVIPTTETLARLCAVDANEAHLHAMFAAEPCLAAVLADSLDPDATTHAAAHAAAQPAAHDHLEAVLDVLVVLSAAPLPLRLLLAKERSLLPRLLGLLGPPTPPSTSRRAAAVLHNLASAPGNHNVFRPYEAGLLGLAMHPTGDFGANSGTVIHEVALELNPTPAW